MPVLKQAGGPNRTPFRFTWQGATIQKNIEDAAAEAMDELERIIQDRFHSELHVLTGEMRDRSFVYIENSGTKRTMRAGSAAEHTLYHELGTATFVGHPQIRTIMDQEIPKLTPLIRAKVAAKASTSG